MADGAAVPEAAGVQAGAEYAGAVPIGADPDGATAEDAPGTTTDDRVTGEEDPAGAADATALDEFEEPAAEPPPPQTASPMGVWEMSDSIWSALSTQRLRPLKRVMSSV